LRKNITARLDEKLYKEIQIIAATLDHNVNDLMEEGLRMVRSKYAGDENIIPNLKSASEKTNTS